MTSWHIRLHIDLSIKTNAIQAPVKTAWKVHKTNELSCCHTILSLYGWITGGKLHRERASFTEAGTGARCAAVRTKFHGIRENEKSIKN
jgi:hypothetical protein